MQRLDQVWAWAISWDAAQSGQVLRDAGGLRRDRCADALGDICVNLGFRNGVPIILHGAGHVLRQAAARTGWRQLHRCGHPSSAAAGGQDRHLPRRQNVWLEDHPTPCRQPADGIAGNQASGYINTGSPRRLATHHRLLPRPRPTWSLAYLEPYGGAISRLPDGRRRLYCITQWAPTWWCRMCSGATGGRAQMEAWLDGFMQLIAAVPE